jgi:hypothetical protein
MQNFPVTAGVNIKMNHPTGGKQNDLQAASNSHAAISSQLAQFMGTGFTLHHFVSGVAGKRANHDSSNTSMAMGPFGFQSPTMWHYFLCISLWGTIASIIVYGRIILPMPDLVDWQPLQVSNPIWHRQHRPLGHRKVIPAVGGMVKLHISHIPMPTHHGQNSINPSTLRTDFGYIVLLLSFA